MSIKRQSLLGLGIALFLLISSMPLKAQDRFQVRNLARTLNNEAREAWNAIQNSRIDRATDPESRRLFWSVRNFQRQTQMFEQDARGYGRQDQLRRQARRLIDQAERIDDMMLRANVPDWVRNRWSDVSDNVQSVADLYNFQYERERGLARRDLDDQYRYRRGY